MFCIKNVFVGRINFISCLEMGGISLDSVSCNVRCKFVTECDSVTVPFSNDRQMESIFKPHCPHELSLAVFTKCPLTVFINIAVC